MHAVHIGLKNITTILFNKNGINHVQMALSDSKMQFVVFTDLKTTWLENDSVNKAITCWLV
jgi:hypothetical protein